MVVGHAYIDTVNETRACEGQRVTRVNEQKKQNTAKASERGTVKYGVVQTEACVVFTIERSQASQQHNADIERCDRT